MLCGVKGSGSFGCMASVGFRVKMQLGERLIGI